jgi:hypothetical protein
VATGGKSSSREKREIKANIRCRGLRLIAAGIKW